jgi:hypothetical protein
MAHRERETRRGRGPGDVPGVLHGVSYWLVGVDRLAGVEALEDDALVSVVWSGDQHPLDLRVPK